MSKSTMEPINSSKNKLNNEIILILNLNLNTYLMELFIYIYKKMCIYYFHVTILASHTIIATNLRKEILIYTPICSFITPFYY